jgi:hypothetical protein
MGPADKVLNIVAQKLQSEGTYKAFGKHTAQQVAPFGDEMAKCYQKKNIYIYKRRHFEAQMGTLSRTSRICTETTQMLSPYPQTSTPHTVAGQRRHCFQRTSFSASYFFRWYNRTIFLNISGITHYDSKEQ